MKESEKLLQKYINGEADSLERSIVEKWYNDLNVPDTSGFTDLQQQEQLEYIRQHLPGHQIKTVKIWPRVAVGIAASVAVIVLSIYFFHYHFKQDVEIVKDLAPGTPGATLTLANGKKIRLSDAGNGELATEAGVTIRKSPGGQLIYEMKGSAAEQHKTNTLTTANGETYQVKLPDGSMVYLNAASSLTYDATLNDNGVRRVELTGEGYFEVANDNAHPFVVKTDMQEVEVLGTHFNINSYSNESATKTTLLEGSIRLNHKIILKPGEQSIVNRSGKIFVEKVDSDNAVAWKNGYFQMDGKDLESIMHEVCRWYDVEVAYQDDNLKKITFVGTVSRYKNVSQVLKTLQMTNTLNFKIDGRIIVISSGTR